MVEQEKVLRVRSQLGKLLQQVGEGKQQLENRDAKLVAKAVTAGFFSHAAQLESAGGNTNHSIRGNHELYIRPASVLFRRFTKVGGVPSTIFLERYYMWNVTAMDPVWLTEVASHFYHFGNTLAGVEGGR